MAPVGKTAPRTYSPGANTPREPPPVPEGGHFHPLYPSLAPIATTAAAGGCCCTAAAAAEVASGWDFEPVAVVSGGCTGHAWGCKVVGGAGCAAAVAATAQALISAQRCNILHKGRVGGQE